MKCRLVSHGLASGTAALQPAAAGGCAQRSGPPSLPPNTTRFHPGTSKPRSGLRAALHGHAQGGTAEAPQVSHCVSFACLRSPCTSRAGPTLLPCLPFSAAACSVCGSRSLLARPSRDPDTAGRARGGRAGQGQPGVTRLRE